MTKSVNKAIAARGAALTLNAQLAQASAALSAVKGTQSNGRKVAIRRTPATQKEAQS